MESTIKDESTEEFRKFMTKEIVAFIDEFSTKTHIDMEACYLGIVCGAGWEFCGRLLYAANMTATQFRDIFVECWMKLHGKGVRGA